MTALTFDRSATHLKATLSGSPTVNEFLDHLQTIGLTSAAHEDSLVLLDLRGVIPVYSFTDHLRMGQEVARCMKHVQKLASVVPADRITRVSEQAARHSGATVQIFVDEAQAVAWLLAGA